MSLTKLIRSSFVFIGFILFLTSCITMNKSRMLKTPKDFEFTAFPDSTIYEAYKISSDDVIELRIYSNEGFKVISLGINGNNNNNNNSASISNTFKVEYDGSVKIPILGRINVAGLSVRNAEHLFEQKLSKYYNNPFVILKIANKRVYLFQGGNQASTIGLTNDNTTLFEVLASAGGISKSGNAKKIKLIRGDLRNPTIYLIDISKVENLPNTDLIMQANDIIYIEPVINIASSVTSDIATILGLFSSLLLVYNLVITN